MTPDERAELEGLRQQLLDTNQRLDAVHAAVRETAMLALGVLAIEVEMPEEPARRKAAIDEVLAKAREVLDHLEVSSKISLRLGHER